MTEEEKIIYDEEMRRRRANTGGRSVGGEQPQNRVLDTLEKQLNRATNQQEFSYAMREREFISSNDGGGGNNPPYRVSSGSGGGGDNPSYHIKNNDGSPNTSVGNKGFITKDGHLSYVDLDEEEIDFSHEADAVVNDNNNDASGIGRTVVDSTTRGVKNTDTYRGKQEFSKALDTASSVFGVKGVERSASKGMAEQSFINAVGADNRNLRVNLKKDIRANLRQSTEDLKGMRINVASLDERKIEHILKKGEFKGQALTQKQIDQLKKHKELLAASRFQEKSSFHLSKGTKAVLDNTLDDNDVYQGGKKVYNTVHNTKRVVNLVKNGGRYTVRSAGRAASTGKRFVVKGARSMANTRLGQKASVVFSTISVFVRNSAPVVLAGKAGAAIRRAHLFVTGKIHRVVNAINSTKLGRFVQNTSDAIARNAKKAAEAAKRKAAARDKKRRDKYKKKQSSKFAKASNKVAKGISKVATKVAGFQKYFYIVIAVICIVWILLVIIMGIFAGPIAWLGTLMSQPFEQVDDGRNAMQRVIDNMYENEKNFAARLSNGSGDLTWQPAQLSYSFNGKYITTYSDVPNRDGLTLDTSPYAGWIYKSENFHAIYEGAVTKYETTTSTSYGTKTEYFWKIKKGKKELTDNIVIYENPTISNYKIKANTGTPVDVQTVGFDGLMKNKNYYVTYDNEAYKLSYSVKKGFTGQALSVCDYDVITISRESREVEDTENVITTTSTTGATASSSFTGLANAINKKTTDIPVWENETDATGTFADYYEIDDDNSVNVEYKFVDKNGNEIRESAFYKAILSIAAAGTDNSSNYDYYNSFADYIYKEAMNHSVAEANYTSVEDSTHKIQWTDGSTYEMDIEQHKAGDYYIYTSNAQKASMDFTITVTADFDTLLGYANAIDDEWQSAHIAYDENPWAETEWPGFLDENNEYTEYAEQAYEWSQSEDEVWDEVYEVKFPGDTYPTLSDEMIDEYMDAIWEMYPNAKRRDERDKFLRAAFSNVGKYYYSYGGGHGIQYDAAKALPGLDCSGFVSLALYEGEVNYVYDTYTCASLLSEPRYLHGTEVSYNTLEPGDIVIKNDKAGENTTSENHVVIFAGYFDAADGCGPAYHFIECTENDNYSGVQISTAARSSFIVNNYSHHILTFGREKID